MPVDSTNIGESSPQADEVIAQDGYLEITGGSVAVPDGNINASGNVTRTQWLDLGDRITTNGSGSDVIGVKDNANNQPIVNWSEGGKVEFPNGDIDVFSNRVLFNNGMIKQNQGAPEIHTGGSGSGDVRIYDSANAQQIARFYEGGDVDFPNGNMDVAGVIRTLNNSYLSLQSPGTSGGEIHLYDRYNSQMIMRLNNGGDVELMNGNLLDGSSNVVYDQSRGVVPEARLTPNAKDVHDSGDYILVDHISVGDNSNHSHANSTYSNANTGALNALRVPRGSVTEKLPTDSTGSTYVSTRLAVNPGSDQIDVRLYDDANATVVHETTGITGGWQGVELGPTLYDWTGDARFLVQTRNSDGATTVYANLNIDVNIYGAK